ncbi:chromosomal replication initiator protein DnaA [Sphingomonas turrisvirgatae]|uniref:Chromosomal replication initiator protein DnaA n=1 Tax=Sphingomonas turrisvirgatae TaxID=1888892 RepID=A0A1E3M0E5_9SPHN|nr:chromosomal replication initiator protein DnaA [Sphingomonas turrisvirgatae]ODP39484.1 chromosomal replication initiation protein DnaA [Sphingomonas turrisvirgatae]
MDQAKAWTRVRGNLRLSAGQRLFDQWLKPIVLLDSEDLETVRLGLPSPFMTNWVKGHYAERLLMEFKALLPQVRSVSIETSSARATRELAAEPVASAGAVMPIAAAEPKASADRPRFDTRFTFERFVVDTSNRVAFNAAKALAEPGAPRFSPLYLHSNTGQGKTHLMHAIGQAYLDAVPEASAIYMPAERFMFEFVRAVRERDTFAFKQRLRGVDLLMIDDLQFIAGKESTQEEFFHTVDEFMREGKRLVIAADRSPLALEGIEARLASRLGSGLAADIKPAEMGLRRTILDRKLEDMPGAVVPGQVLDLLAARISSSVRELEGALNRLVAYAQLNGEVVTIEFAESVLGEALRGSQRRITIDEIQKAVSSHFDVKQLDLVSQRRAVAIARPRQIAMYLAKRLTTRSLPEIGRKFGNRDHSTVIHAVRRIEELRGTDSEIDGAVRSLMRQLEA